LVRGVTKCPRRTIFPKDGRESGVETCRRGRTEEGGEIKNCQPEAGEMTPIGLRVSFGTKRRNPAGGGKKKGEFLKCGLRGDNSIGGEILKEKNNKRTGGKKRPRRTGISGEDGKEPDTESDQGGKGV